MAEEATLRILARVRQLEETARVHQEADTTDPAVQERLARLYQELAELQDFAEVARRVETLEQQVAGLARQVETLAPRTEA